MFEKHGKFLTKYLRERDSMTKYSFMTFLEEVKKIYLLEEVLEI